MTLQPEIKNPKGLGVKKFESGGVDMVLKTGIKVGKYYTVFNYGPQDHRTT